MTSSSNSGPGNSCSAKKGFLLSDALIAVAIIALMALITDSAISRHASVMDETSKAISTIEEEASWHLKECQSCVPDVKEDLSSEEP